MKLELRLTDPNLKKILLLAKQGELNVKYFKTKVVIYIKQAAPHKSKNIFKQIIRSTDTYNLMSWI